MVRQGLGRVNSFVLSQFMSYLAHTLLHISKFLLTRVRITAYISPIRTYL